MMSPVTTDLALMDHRERLITAERVRQVRIARALRLSHKNHKESSWERSSSAASSAWTGTPKDPAET